MHPPEFLRAARSACRRRRIALARQPAQGQGSRDGMGNFPDFRPAHADLRLFGLPTTRALIVFAERKKGEK
jgi:hypothetical protein